MNWEDLSQKRIKPPYQPKTKGGKDTSNFEKIFTDAKVEESLEINELAASPNEFSGFTYKERDSLSTTNENLTESLIFK